jgi:hypothetical protein
VTSLRQPQRWNRTATAEVVIGSVGIAIMICAAAGTQHWLDRHFMPSFFLPRDSYVLIENAVRIGIAVAGGLIAFVVRRPVARLVTRAPSRALSVTLAAVLALTASEMLLRRVQLRPAEWLGPQEEPRRQPDAHLGWAFVPSRIGQSTMGGRTIDYALDANGYRVAGADRVVDRERPAILFIGESIMFGEGLAWNETVPAQVEMMTGIPGANLAVHGFSTDQAYLRLAADLPRFRSPVAVISLFMTALFGRNLDDDRPHLGPGLAWLPAVQHSRLKMLAKLLVPFRRDETVERGIATTGEVMRATANLARARGAIPLVVVPQFGTEAPVEERLRRRILDDNGVPYVFVTLDPAWHLAWDRHPDARGAHAIASAVAERLHQLTSRTRNPL